MEYSFNFCNKMAPSGLVLALDKFLQTERQPVILCIGSDLAIGDSLGPVCGTLLQERSCGFVYGTLRQTVTAKEVRYMNEFLRDTHPAARHCRRRGGRGCGRYRPDKDLRLRHKAGLGANKKLGKVGDVGIMGIVAEKSLFNYSLLNLTRLNLVYRMAEIIAEAISAYAAPRARAAG